ncbi:hypothetical protein MBLNU13_g10740t1 [Cladosporium sp. NU13]
MSVPADPLPVALTADGKKSLDTTQKPGFVDSSSKLSADSLPVSEAELKANPFLDPVVAETYRQIYNEAGYECREAFDPDLQWTQEEEKKLKRKLDLHVAFWACVMFFALNVDRGNLKQAIADNLLDDLGLTTNDYNTGNTIFYLSFLAAELPSQLISKKLGPDRWIPMQVTLWSVVAAAQAGMTGKGSFFATRALLGALEGGFIPDLILWLSYFYTSSELSLRLSWFWISRYLTMVVTSVMAYGLLHMRGIHNMAGWRWLFLIEGLITIAIGVASFFLMPASATQTKTWFRPKGWFTDREVGIVVNRVLRDDPSKGDMNNRTGLSLKNLWDAVSDYDLWPIYLIGCVFMVPQSTPDQYITLTLRSLGYDQFEANLLSIPNQFISCFTLFAATWFSEFIGQRMLVASTQNIWLLPCLIALRWWPGAGQVSSAWATFALLTVLLSTPYTHPINVSLCSRNSGSVRTRSVSAAFYNMCVQAGTIISSNIYRADDKPLYHRGNEALLGIDILAIVLFVGAKVYYVWRNKQKEAKWSAMSEEEKSDYVANTKDEGNKRLDFRFAS